MKVKPEAPKIEFPCANYSLKIVGRKTVDYHTWVVATDPPNSHGQW